MKVTTFEDIKKAQEKLKGIVKKTSMSHSRNCSEWAGTNIHLKMENEQYTGSFKVRGAYNKIQSLTDEEKKRGVIASSAGNHAQGVALSSKLSGVSAKIVMPEPSPIVKVEATRSYGAEVILKGEFYDDAFSYAQELKDKEGYTFVPPYEDPYIIAGQGTMGLEIFEDLPEADCVICSIGGGGMISGTALAMKTLNPKCKIIGVVSDSAQGMREMFQHQQPTNNKRATIADGISVKRPSPYMYDNYISKYVDEIVAVSDDEIAESIVFLLERAKSVVEGAGAAALAGAMKAKDKLGTNSVVLLSGGNIDMNLVATIINRGLVRQGRLAYISVIVEDRPGKLSKLVEIMAEAQANILEVRHDRASGQLMVKEALIEFLVETKNGSQIEEIRQKLLQTGAKILK